MTRKYLKESDFLREIQGRMIPQTSATAGNTGWKKHMNLYAHYKNGHYENDPALGVSIVRYDYSGNLLEEQSRVNGVNHSDDGPAQVVYDNSGAVKESKWWLNGISVSAAEHEKYRLNKQSTTVDIKIADGSIKKINKKVLENIKKHLKDSIEITPSGDVLNLSMVSTAGLNSKNKEALEKTAKFIYDEKENLVYSRKKNFFGPVQLTFNSDGSVHLPTYALEDNVGINQFQWKAQLCLLENGLPKWVRHTQLENYGFDAKQTFVPLTKDQEQKVGYEALSKDHPVRFSYVGSDSILYLIFKDPSEPGVFYEKSIPTYALFKDSDRVATLNTDFESRHDTYKRAKYITTNGRLEIKVVESITAKKFQEVADKVNSLNNVNGIEKKPIVPTEQVDKFIAEISENVVKKLESEMLKQVKEGKEAEEITLADIQMLKDNVEKINKMLSSIQLNDNGEIKTEIPHPSKVLDPKLWDIIKTMPTTQKVIPYELAQNATMTTNKVNVFSDMSIKLDTELIAEMKSEVKSENKLVQTVKSDAVEVAKRIAANKIVSLINDLIIKTMIQKVGGRHKSSLLKFFESTNGKAFVGIATGIMLPLLADKLPEQYRPYLNEMADEFRVSGETDIVSQLAEFAAGPLFSSVADSLKTLDLFSGNNPELVRVDTSEPAHVPVESGEFEEVMMKNIENLKELN